MRVERVVRWGLTVGTVSVLYLTDHGRNFRTSGFKIFEQCRTKLRQGEGVVGSTQPWGREAPKQVREEGAENDSERCIALHIVLSCPPVDKSARLLDGTVTTLSVRLPEGSAHFQVWLKCSCRQPSNSYISMKASESKERAVSSMLRETYPTLISLQRAERATTG